MVFTHEAPLDAPAGAVRLDEWLFNLSEADYLAAAKGHRAIGTNRGSNFEGMVNVESIGGNLLVQHYRTELLKPSHVRLVSPASQAYVFHLFPVRVGVVWEMQVVNVSATESRLRCSIDVRIPLWLRIMGIFVASNHWVRKHLFEETGGFARDLARKRLMISE